MGEAEVHMLKGPGSLWRTLRLQVSDGQPLEDVATNRMRSHALALAQSLFLETDGLPSGSWRLGKLPILLSNQNSAPSPHPGASVTPNLPSKVPRLPSTGHTEHPCHASIPEGQSHGLTPQHGTEQR